MNEKKTIEGKNQSDLLGLPKGVEPFLDRIGQILFYGFSIIILVAIVGSVVSFLLESKYTILGFLYLAWEGIVWLFSKIWWVGALFFGFYILERIVYHATSKALRDFHGRNNR